MCLALHLRILEFEVSFTCAQNQRLDSGKLYLICRSLESAGMASSSTQPQFLTYDIFLNHRGPDTKKGFVDRLDRKLRKKGFQPFLDRNDIDYGEHVFQTIEEGIRSAHMHIAVFSKDYAKSTSCLDELHQMVLTKKPIITVFYDVKPEHLKRPSDPDGPYTEAFKKHEERQKPEVVQRWLSALEHAADIRGFIRDKKEYNRTDDELLEDILIAVGKIRYPTLREPLDLPIKIPAMHGQYSWINPYQLPEEGRGFVSFSAECSHNVMVAISPEPQSTDPMYEIVIGESWNTETIIRRRPRRGPELCSVPVGLLNYRPETVNHIWVFIDERTQLIQVGRGRQPSLESLFCICKDAKFIRNARYICFTSWDTPSTYSKISVASLSKSQDFTKQLFMNMGEVDIIRELSDLRTFVVAPMEGIYNWAHHFQLPEQGRGFVSFAVKFSAMDVHIAISPERQSVVPMYEILIGVTTDNREVKARIRRRSQGAILCNAAYDVQRDTVNHLWVSIDAEPQLIQIGRGRQPSPESMFCIYKDNRFIREARYICFTTWDQYATYSGISVAALPTDQGGIRRVTL